MKREIGIAVSALIVASQLGSPLVAAEPSIEQLSQMVIYLENNDIEALRAFILQNPELLEGDTRIALLLRQFMADSENLMAYLSRQPDLSDIIDALPGEGSSGY